VLGEEGDKTELEQETRLGEARDSLEDITKEKRFAVGVTEEREETKFCEGSEGNGRHINADRLRRGKNGTKVLVIDNFDGGHEEVGGDNGMEESVDSGKGGCVGPYFIIDVYLVSYYRPSHSPLSKSMHLVPLLLHHPLKVSGGFRGTHNRKETLEGDQELYLSAPAHQQASTPCHAARKWRRRRRAASLPRRSFKSAGAGVHRGGGGGGQSGREEGLKAGAAAALW
jgi:hypothetical protein